MRRHSNPRKQTVNKNSSKQKKIGIKIGVTRGQVNNKKQPQECWTDLSFNKINIIRWQVNSKYDASVSVSLKLPVNNGCSLVRLQPTQNTITGVTDLIQAYRTRGKPPTKWTDAEQMKTWCIQRKSEQSGMRLKQSMCSIGRKWLFDEDDDDEDWRGFVLICIGTTLKTLHNYFLDPQICEGSCVMVCNKIIVCLIPSLDLLLLYSSKPFWIQFTLNRHIDSFMNMIL